MLKHLRKQSKKIGLPPGTVMHVGEKKIDKARIRVIDYTESELNEMEAENIEEVFKYKDTSSTTWINIDGLHKSEIIEKIGKHFNIHPLVLEDIVNTGQRPKFEESDDYQDYLKDIRDFLISFQEKVGDIFNPLSESLG